MTRKTKQMNENMTTRIRRAKAAMLVLAAFGRHGNLVVLPHQTRGVSGLVEVHAK